MRLKLVLCMLALVALAMSSAADRVDDLILDLKDDDQYVRRDAAWPLGQIGDERAVDPLIDALKDESESVRMDAARALGYIGDDRAVDPLIEALKDEYLYYVRMFAAWSLGQIGDERAVDPLIEALKDEEMEVRRPAAGALGCIGDPRAIDPLTHVAQNDTAENVRGIAKEALEDLKPIRLTVERGYKGVVADGVTELEIIAELPEKAEEPCFKCQFKSDNDTECGGLSVVSRHDNIVKLKFKPEEEFKKPYVARISASAVISDPCNYCGPHNERKTTAYKDIEVIRTPVVLIHGIWSSNASMQPLRWQLILLTPPSVRDIPDNDRRL